MQQTLTSQLCSKFLEKRNSLPDKPSQVILQGKYVRLEPLVMSRDVGPLFMASNGNPIQHGERSVGTYDPDVLIWRYIIEGPFNHIDNFQEFLQTQVNSPNGLCFCVFDNFSRQQIGVTNFMNNFPMHLKMEIGNVWYSPIAQRTHANTESTFLMLRHAFHLGYRRLEWKCHASNERSRRAALRMGFKFEGIHENHMIVKGCNRDTAWFRILENEWEEDEKKFKALLNY